MQENNHSHWRVGDRIFYSKALAVEYASRSGLPMTYDFYNDFYDRLDWSIESSHSLKELYRARAEQLLSSYDRVILLLSGGSDSTAMVNTFVQNGLKPHEVVSYALLNDTINKNSITNLEVTLGASKTAKSVMEAGIPYRVINLWDNIRNVNYDYKWFETADCRMSIDNLIKIEGLNNDKQIRGMVDSGLKVCIVNGLEKPRVFVHEGYFQTAHLDHPLTGNFYAKELSHDNGLYTERFYTTIDMPEIEIKQCHTIIKHYENNVPDYQNVLLHTANFDVQKYFSQVNDILYPNLWKNSEYFTLGKAAGPEKYRHFERVMSGHKIVEQYRGLVRDFYRSIDSKKYINNFIHPSGRMSSSEFTDLVGFYSGFYKIKKLNANESAK